MPCATQAITPIPHAHAGTITDDLLDRISDVASKAQDGLTLTEAEAGLILISLPQICDELRQRRGVMDLINSVTDSDKVTLLFPKAQAADQTADQIDG